MTEVHYEITINATPEVVYRHLAERDGLLRWMGVEVTADPVPGGELRWTHENGATMIGRFIELDPPHRLVFNYGWEDNLMGVPPESTTVEIQLTADHRQTKLRLAHRDLPSSATDDHRRGWDHFLTQLAELLTDTSSTPTPYAQREQPEPPLTTPTPRLDGSARR